MEQFRQGEESAESIRIDLRETLDSDGPTRINVVETIEESRQPLDASGPDDSSGTCKSSPVAEQAKDLQVGGINDRVERSQRPSRFLDSYLTDRDLTEDIENTSAWQCWLSEWKNPKVRSRMLASVVWFWLFGFGLWFVAHSIGGRDELLFQLASLAVILLFSVFQAIRQSKGRFRAWTVKQQLLVGPALFVVVVGAWIWLRILLPNDLLAVSPTEHNSGTEPYICFFIALQILLLSFSAFSKNVSSEYQKKLADRAKARARQRTVYRENQ